MIKYQNIYFRENGDKLTSDIIRAINFGAPLPKDYQEFLIEINGGMPDKNNIKIQTQYYNNETLLDRFFGITTRHDNNLLERLDLAKGFKGIIPNDSIPIAIDCSGNLFFIALKCNGIRGKIYYWDHDYTYHSTAAYNPNNPIIISDSFNEFLSLLH